MSSPSTAKPARKRAGHYHHGDLRQALLLAAVRTIDRDGVDALTLRAVGASLSVSRTALYRHFADKNTLLAAVAAEGFRTLHTDLVGSWERGGRGLAGFHAMGLAYIGFGTTHPSHYRVMFGGHHATAAKDADLELAGAAAFMALVDALVELQGLGLVQRDDPLMQARYVWATVHGVTMLLITERMGAQPTAGDTLARYSVARITAGLRP
jgi:AcrR family transcriptional regulator